MENYIIFEKKNADFVTFVNYWSEHFNFDRPLDWAIENVQFGKALLTPSDIKQLFSNKDISENNSFWVKKSIPELLKDWDTIRKLQKQFDETVFQNEFGNLSVVGQIVLLQVIQPGNFPLFDTHIFRGFSYLKKNKVLELNDLTKQEQFNAYLAYKTFVFAQKDENFTIRKIDKAIWAFGKYLENPNFKWFMH